MTTTSGEPLPGFHPIVPAGGAGTRLWPLSRAGRPKFLLDLTGSGRSLLQQTWDRLAPLADHGDVLVVTGAAHAEAVAEQLAGLAADDLLAEPSARDSAAAIGLAAAVIARRFPDAIVGSFAADHVVRDLVAFRAAVTEAVAVARTGYLVTIGIEPDHASTAYGYIRLGKPLEVIGAPSAHSVVEFVEKPDAATAAGYLAQGEYRWNAGMFVAPAQFLLDELRSHRPELHRGLTTIADAWDTPQRTEVLAAVWPSLEKVALDYAVAEPAAAAGRVAVVPASFGWHDIGDFASLAQLVSGTPDAGGTILRVLGDEAHVLAPGVGGLAVPGAGRLVAVIGLEDVVVVDTPDALLVTTLARAQEVKTIVEGLRAASRGDLL